MGSILRYKGTKKDGTPKDLMLQFVGSDGKRCYESAGTTDRKEARRRLAEIEGEIAKGKVKTKASTGRRAATFDDAVALWDAEQVVNKNTSRGEQRRRLDNHLRPVFGEKRLADIKTADVKRYYESRLAAGAAQATAGNELSILRTMLKLATAAGVLHSAPPDFEWMPTPDNARQGFFEREQYLAQREALESDLDAAAYWPDLLTAGYCTGWRLASEVAYLLWTDYDVVTETLSIPASRTKNGIGKSFPVALLPELKACIARRWLARKPVVEGGRAVSRIFHDGTGAALTATPTGTKRTGSFKPAVQKAWRDAAVVSGVDRKPHDMRRSAARNLLRGGVEPKTVCELVGMSREMLDRYNIVNDSDLAAAVAKLAAYTAAVDAKLAEIAAAEQRLAALAATPAA